MPLIGRLAPFAHTRQTIKHTTFIITQTEQDPLPSPSELVTSVTTLLNNTSMQIATSLTSLDALMYSRLRPADYINYLRELQGPNRVADACASTLKIILWVKQKVLRSENIKRRGKAFKFFLETAEVGLCYLLGYCNSPSSCIAF